MRSNPLLGLHVNFCGTANVLEAARQHGIARVVNASSTTVLYSGFGRLPAAPISEDVAMKLISERPASLYTITKQASEQLCLHYRDSCGVDTVTLRFAAVLGGNLVTPTSVPGRLMATLINGAKTGRVTLTDQYLLWAGTEEFVDARDCARSILHALDADEAPQGVYNIAHHNQYTLQDFADSVRQAVGPFDLELPIEVETGFAGFPHKRPAPCDTSAAKSELGFVCQHDLTDSVRYWSDHNQ
jgi:UDP-glucose 4-epimerase